MTMPVSAIGSMSGSTSVNAAATELQKAQEKLASDLAAKAAEKKLVVQDRDAVARAQQAAEAAKAAQAAQMKQDAQMMPATQSPREQSKPVTASSSALGGSFDMRM
jgi:peptidoglycan hydrolase CwlO-like protein